MAKAKKSYLPPVIIAINLGAILRVKLANPTPNDTTKMGKTTKPTNKVNSDSGTIFSHNFRHSAITMP